MARRSSQTSGRSRAHPRPQGGSSCRARSQAVLPWRRYRTACVRDPELPLGRPQGPGCRGAVSMRPLRLCQINQRIRSQSALPVALWGIRSTLLDSKPRGAPRDPLTDRTLNLSGRFDLTRPLSLASRDDRAHDATACLRQGPDPASSPKLLGLRSAHLLGGACSERSGSVVALYPV